MRTVWKRLLVGLVGVAVAGGAAVGLAPPDAAPPPHLPVTIPPADAPAPLQLAAAEEPAPRPEAAVALEWSGPPTVRVNRPTEYTLTVRNTSALFVQKVVVQVRPPKDAKLTQTAPAATVVDGVHLWELGTLEAKDTRHLKMTLTPSARGDLGCQAWVTFTGTAGMKVAVQEPKLEASIKAPAAVAVGDEFQVSYRVKNVGNCTAESYFVLKLFSAGPNPIDCPGFGRTLEAQQTDERTETLRATTPGEHTYRISASASDTASTVATAKIRVLAPKLTATISGPAEVLVGRKATYKVTLQNVGELSVKDIALAKTLPAGWKMLNAGGETAPELAPGQLTETAFDALPAATGAYPVLVKVSGNRGATATAECSTRVSGIPALRVELVDLVDPVEKGQTTTYEIRVTNTGTMADENVVVTCPLPEQLKFVSATGPVGHAVDDLNNCGVVRFEPVRELAPKTEAVFRVTVKAVGTGDVRFKAQVNSKHLTTSVVKEESTRVYGD